MSHSIFSFCENMQCKPLISAADLCRREMEKCVNAERKLQLYQNNLFLFYIVFVYIDSCVIGLFVIKILRFEKKRNYQLMISEPTHARLGWIRF